MTCHQWRRTIGKGGTIREWEPNRKGLGVHPKAWTREDGRTSEGVNLDFFKSGGSMAWVVPMVPAPLPGT